MTRRAATLFLLMIVSGRANDARQIGKMRGVCWEAVGKVGAGELAPLKDVGVNWISQTPFGWCRSVHSPDVILATGARVYWGESDEGLVETARAARAIGIRTLLKPHLWVGHRDWVGDLKMESESDWKAWFGSYEKFILHYAELAEREHFDALAVGTELCGTSSRAADWKRLIAKIRSVYHGPLTYCANWEEAERVAFWKDLDFIGVQAYYPLSAAAHPTPAELRASWERIGGRLETLSGREGRPVVFTEIGYRSVAGAVKEPWNWETDGGADLQIQSEAYEALYDRLWDKAWFGGTFIWKWNPYRGSGKRAPRDSDRDFTPQGKPALDVIRAYYREKSRR
ncbi:MAG: glycoside hydrolase family 113 [Thermoanaerobaculia bacterium]